MSLDAAYHRMRALGFAPSRILDIGAYKGDWTRHARMFFPNAAFTLIEANDHPELLGSGRVIKALLSDTPGEVDWYSNGGTGDSMMQELTGHFVNVRPIVRDSTTLDVLFPNDTVDFIKIDCQGAEIAILKGGRRLVGTCSAILLECPFACQYNKGCPSFAEYIAYLDQIGFIPFELTEIHCVSNVTLQVDILFVRATSPLAGAAQSVIERMK